MKKREEGRKQLKCYKATEQIKPQEEKSRLTTGAAGSDVTSWRSDGH